MKLEHNFISQEDMDTIIEFVDSQELRTADTRYDGRQMIWEFRDTSIREILYKYISTIVNMFDHPVYPHEIGMFRYGPSVGMTRHSDHDGPCVDNCTDTAIIHLGKDYEGGLLVYPDLDITYKLEAGDMLLSPQIGKEYEHMVTPIISGDRYSVVVCFTPNKSMTNPAYLD